MRIGMLTDVYKPVINGITNSIALCKREMENAGHQVTVFTFGEMTEAIKESGVVRSPALPLADTGYHLGLAYSRDARELVATMDILHVHHPFISGQLAVHHGRQLDLPIVFTNHTRYDLYVQAYLPLIPPGLTQLVLEAYMPAFAALCDLVIAPSAGLRQVLIDLGVKREIAIIPNGIDLERVQHPVHRVTRSALDIPETAVVLIYCGRLAPEKSVSLLLQAFRGAAAAVPDAYLLLVGGGPDESDLREVGHDVPRVRFTGAVPYDEVPAYLALADAFVTASVTEVHPLSIIEALAAGLPVLAMHSPGISDTVRDGVDGYLTDRHLPSFTAMMVRLLLEPDRRVQMASSATERAQQFAITQTVSALLDHYARLLTSKPDRTPKENIWQSLPKQIRQVFGE